MTFQKGHNIGRPKGSKSKLTIANNRLTALVTTLDQIVNDPSSSETAKLSAVAMLVKLWEAVKS